MQPGTINEFTQRTGQSQGEKEAVFPVGRNKLAFVKAAASDNVTTHERDPEPDKSFVCGGIALIPAWHFCIFCFNMSCLPTELQRPDIPAGRQGKAGMAGNSAGVKHWGSGRIDAPSDSERMLTR